MTISLYSRSAFGVEVRPTLVYERPLDLASTLCWNSKELGLRRIPSSGESYSFDWIEPVKHITGRARHKYLRDVHWCSREQVLNVLLDTAMQAHRADSQDLLSSLTGADFHNADFIKFKIGRPTREYTGVPDSAFIDLNSRSIALIEIKIGLNGAKYSIEQDVKYQTMATLLRTEAFFPGFQIFKILLAPHPQFRKNVLRSTDLGASSDSLGRISFTHDSDALRGLAPEGHADIVSLVAARLLKITQSELNRTVPDDFDGQGVLFFPWPEVVQRCPKGFLKDNLTALLPFLAPENLSLQSPAEDETRPTNCKASETEIDSAGWYNGYSWSEREAKLRELKRRMARGEQASATGPCQLCGDPDVPVEYHDEDYSQPFAWEPPALLALCRNCHRDKLHKRFLRPDGWKAFLAHVRRGGYARDLKVPEIKLEVRELQAALSRGESLALKPLRPYAQRTGKEWFAELSTDPNSLASESSRPRP